MPEMTAKPQLPERTPRVKGEPTALDGLLVVDFTRVVAGPACRQTLADFGAEVIKIENPDGGDDSRAYEHAEIGGESAAFLSLNFFFQAEDGIRDYKVTGVQTCALPI